MKYICPLCKSPLTENHYHKVVKIQEDEKKVQKGDLEKLKRQIVAKEAAVAAAQKREKETKLKSKQRVEDAREQAVSLERRKNAIRDKRLISRIKKLEEEKKIVAQAGVLTLAYICRDSLIGMAKQRLDAAQKEAAAKRLMDYVTSPVCKTPLEEAISQTERAHKNLVKEIKQHVGDWKDRHEIYQTIHYDVSHIQENVGRVLNGKEPIKLEKPRFEPLALENKI